MDKRSIFFKKFLEIYFWASGALVLLINFLLVLPGTRKHPVVLWLENYILDHWNSPLEEMQVVILIFIIFQLVKFPRGWFKSLNLVGFIFILGEEIAWGNTYFNMPKILLLGEFMTTRGDIHNHEVMKAEMLDIFVMISSLYMAAVFFSEGHFRRIKQLLRFPLINLSDSLANIFIFGSVMSYLNLIGETSVIDTVFIQSFYVIFAITLIQLRNGEPFISCSRKKLNLCYALALIQVPRIALLALNDEFRIYSGN
jgi:hypothetical protein